MIIPQSGITNPKLHVFVILVDSTSTSPRAIQPEMHENVLDTLFSNIIFLVLLLVWPNNCFDMIHKIFISLFCVPDMQTSIPKCYFPLKGIETLQKVDI